MIVVVVVAILAAIALPTYQSYMQRSRAKAAGTDLVALGLNVENFYQKRLTYPTDLTDPDDWQGGWSPAMGDHFSYGAAFQSDRYVLTASGSGAMNGCSLTLTVRHQGNTTRTASGCALPDGTW